MGTFAAEAANRNYYPHESNLHNSTYSAGQVQVPDCRAIARSLNLSFPLILESQSTHFTALHGGVRTAALEATVIGS